MSMASAIITASEGHRRHGQGDASELIEAAGSPAMVKVRMP
jgi:hypothetical protein